MKAANFFTYERRLSLYKPVYRDLLKTAQKRYADDTIVQGHIKIKSRYLIRLVRNEHNLKAIQSNFKLV